MLLPCVYMSNVQEALCYIRYILTRDLKTILYKSEIDHASLWTLFKPYGRS